MRTVRREKAPPLKGGSVNIDDDDNQKYRSMRNKLGQPGFK